MKCPPAERSVKPALLAFKNVFLHRRRRVVHEGFSRMIVHLKAGMKNSASDVLTVS